MNRHSFCCSRHQFYPTKFTRAKMSNKRYLGHFRAIKRHSIIRHRDVSLLNEMKLGAMTLNLLQLQMMAKLPLFNAIGINQPYVES